MSEAQSEGRPTIRTVAERAGVSKSLVSLVLRGSEQVRPEKREAVLRAMAELGYRPNAAARSLSEQRTRTVGVLLNDLRNPWFVDLLDGLNSLLHDNGLHMILADGRLNRRIGQDLTRPFLDLQVDGLIAVGTLPDPAALGTAAARIPVVVAGTREPVLPGVDVVANDDEHGARLATEHLIGLGHRAIAHIAGYGAVGDLRRRSFEATMHAHGLADDALVEPSDMTEEGGYRATVRLLSGPGAPPRSSPSTTSPPSARSRPPTNSACGYRATCPWSDTTTPASPGCGTCGSPPSTPPATTSADAPPAASWTASPTPAAPPGYTCRRRPWRSAAPRRRRVELLTGIGAAIDALGAASRCATPRWRSPRREPVLSDLVGMVCPRPKGGGLRSRTAPLRTVTPRGQCATVSGAAVPVARCA